MKVIVDYRHQGTHDEGSGRTRNWEGYVPALLDVTVNHASSNHGFC